MSRSKNKSEVAGLASQGKADLIASIEADAHAEEEKIFQDGLEQAGQRGRYTEKKIESMLEEARERGVKQGQVIRDQAISQAELEIRRRGLRARNEIIGKIMLMVEKKLGEMIGDDSYREVLIVWIVEAALGLNADEAIVNASVQERELIDESLIGESQKRIEQSRGKGMRIRVADGPAAASQGVILTTENGRMAYNNQVKTRLLRRRQEVQRMIYDCLFGEDV